MSLFFSFIVGSFYHLQLFLAFLYPFLLHCCYLWDLRTCLSGSLSHWLTLWCITPFSHDWCIVYYLMVHSVFNWYVLCRLFHCVCIISSFLTSSFTSRLWCYGIALAIVGTVLGVHTCYPVYYILFFSPGDILFKLPSPTFLACYLLNTVQLISTTTKRPFAWKDCLHLFNYKEYDFKIGFLLIYSSYP